MGSIGASTTITDGEDAERTFAGSGGQPLTLAVSGNTFSGGVTLTVRTPSGTPDKQTPEGTADH